MRLWVKPFSLGALKHLHSARARGFFSTGGPMGGVGWDGHRDVKGLTLAQL